MLIIRALLLGVTSLTLPLWALGATLPPEAAIELDLRWLSPPAVLPQTGAATAEMNDGFTRLNTRFTAEGSSFTWPIRYAIPARNYPIVVLRYRAQNLFTGPSSQNTVLQMNLASAAGQVTPVIVVEMQELLQDGVVHEIRKDLSRVAGEGAIDAIRFSFNTSATGGRLDVYELRFEQGPSTVAPFALPREAVQFSVTDASGNAISDAEVRAGLIERSNWTTLANTNGSGQVTLPVIRPVRPDGSSPDPVEAMVLKDGFVPQYVAPIEFPRTGPMQVKLTAAAQPTSGAQPQQQVPQPIGQEPERTVYVPSQATYVYQSSPSVVYVEQYAPFWWVPRTYVGYHPYYPYYYHGGHAGFYNRRDHGFHGSVDVRERDDRRDFGHDRDFDRDRVVTPRPSAPPVRDTPRERAREEVRREIDRGNEPATGIETSTIYRRAENNPRGTAAPTPAPDRGDRYRPESSSAVDRGNEPDARPDTRAPRRVEAPRPAAPTPAPEPERARPPIRVSPSPAPAAPAPAAPAPAPDRGDRYRRDAGSDRNRGNEPDARPRAIAPSMSPIAPAPSRNIEPRRLPAPSVAPAPRPTPPTITRERRPEPPMAAAPAPRPAPSESILREQVRRGNEPSSVLGSRDMGRAQPSAQPAAGRMERSPSPAAPQSGGGSPSGGDRGSRYSR